MSTTFVSKELSITFFVITRTGKHGFSVVCLKAILILVSRNWIVSMYRSYDSFRKTMPFNEFINNISKITIPRCSYLPIIYSHFLISCQKYFRNYANQKCSTLQKLRLTWPYVVLMNVKSFDVAYYAKRRFILCCIKSNLSFMSAFYVTR